MRSVWRVITGSDSFICSRNTYPHVRWAILPLFPSRRTLPLSGQHSFSVPQRTGGWVGVNVRCCGAASRSSCRRTSTSSRRASWSATGSAATSRSSSPSRPRSPPPSRGPARWGSRGRGAVCSPRWRPRAGSWATSTSTTTHRDGRTGGWHHCQANPVWWFDRFSSLYASPTVAYLCRPSLTGLQVTTLRAFTCIASWISLPCTGVDNH